MILRSNNYLTIDIGNLYGLIRCKRVTKIKNKNVVVLGADIPDNLFDWIDPLDKEVNIGEYKATVIGVLEKKGAIFGISQDNFAIIPLSLFKSFYGDINRSLAISIMASDNQLYNELIELAQGYFRGI